MALNRRNKRKLMAEINITPLVDVILVLLIIFMISSPMLTTGFDVSLPSASSSPAINMENKQLVLNVDQKGLMSVDGKRVSNLISYLEKNNYDKSTHIIIGGDKRAKYQSIIAIMGSLNQSGYQTISLVTDDDSVKAK